MIDLSVSRNYQCPDWVDYPFYNSRGTGGLLGTIPIICGGAFPVTDKCYKITTKKAVVIGRSIQGLPKTWTENLH